MAEASNRLPIHQAQAKTEALRLARNAVRADIKARGERIKDYEHSEITRLAVAWFSSHRAEVLGQAVVALWFAAERKSKYLQRRSSPEKSTASAVQISRSKVEA
jgi:hypothetical protein